MKDHEYKVYTYTTIDRIDVIGVTHCVIKRMSVGWSYE